MQSKQPVSENKCFPAATKTQITKGRNGQGKSVEGGGGSPSRANPKIAAPQHPSEKITRVRPPPGKFPRLPGSSFVPRFIVVCCRSAVARFLGARKFLASQTRTVHKRVNRFFSAYMYENSAQRIQYCFSSPSNVAVFLPPPIDHFMRFWRFSGSS